jgi:2-methylcitrate dehydratase PrpD
VRPSAPRDDAATVLRAAWERDVVLVQVGDDDVLTARIHGGPPVRAEVFVEDGRGTLAVRAGEPAGDRRG